MSAQRADRGDAAMPAMGAATAPLTGTIAAPTTALPVLSIVLPDGSTPTAATVDADVT